MKTKLDYISEINALTEKCEQEVEKLLDYLFNLYREDEKVKEILKNVDECKNPDYGFNEYGDFIQSFKVNLDLEEYLYFCEFVDRNTGGNFNSDEKTIEIVSNSPITINWAHDRGEYFIYNLDTRKPILESNEGLDKLFIELTLEKYQRDLGEFNDIIVIDRYGHYVEHFETSKEVRNLTDDQLKEALEKFNK